MLIKDLHDQHIIGVRPYRVCLSNGLHTVQDAQHYFEVHRTFKNFKNCGTRADEELKAMLRTYAVPEEAEDAPYIKQLVLALTKDQREFLDDMIALDTAALSRIAEAALTYCVDYDMSIDNLVQRFFYAKNVDLTHIVHAQKKQDEIKTYLENIKSYLFKVEGTSDIQLYIWRARMGLSKAAVAPHLLKANRSKAAYLERYASRDLQVQSVFENVAYALKHQLLYKPTYTAIFVKSLNIHRDAQPVDHRTLANLYKKPVATISQIQSRSVDSLLDKVKGMCNPSEDFESYGMDLSSTHLDITDAMVETINQQYRLNFSKEFITYIVYAALSDSYQLLGNPRQLFRYELLKPIRRYRWKRFYVLKNAVADALDWDALALDMYHRVDADVETDYILELVPYVKGFLTDATDAVLSDCIDFFEFLLKEEFALQPQQGRLLFHRNTYKKKYEYVVEALEAIGKPTHIKELYAWVEARYPGSIKSAERLRSTLQQDERLMLAGGRSTYALKAWEDTKPDVKGGTIRQLVRALLAGSESPLHIQTILDHIHTYRPATTERSVITNLKMIGGHYEFVFYPSKFIGLKGKQKLPQRKKYEGISPFLLRKIKGLMQRGVITKEKAMIKYLKSNYKLTPVECEAIFRNAGIEFRK